jgi:hypothetical protein
MTIFWNVKQCNLTDFHQRFNTLFPPLEYKCNYQTTQYHVTENGNAHTHHHDNLKLHIKITVFIHSWYTLSIL